MRGLLRNWRTQDLLRHSTVNNREITVQAVQYVQTVKAVGSSVRFRQFVAARFELF